MKQQQAESLARLFIAFLETGNVPPGLFAPDVFCDFTLPIWRLQARGVAAPPAGSFPNRLDGLCREGQINLTRRRNRNCYP